MMGELVHVDYPHDHGYLYDCPACEARCHCEPGAAECVYEGEHNGGAAVGTVWFLWFGGGGNYAPGYVETDVETTTSLDEVRRICRNRYNNVDGSTPCVGDDSQAWVWFSDPRDMADPYPDRIVTRGPRGGWNAVRA